MRALLILFILVFIMSSRQAYPKPSDKKKQITRNLELDTDNLIPEGEHTVEVMDVVTVSPRRQELMAKLMQAIQTNREWFMEQQKIAKETGQTMPYDARIGLSEQEFKEYKELAKTMNDMEASSSGKQKIFVSKSNGIISFKAEGKLSYLNSIRINTENNTVKFSQSTLFLSDTVCVVSPDNVFKTAWRGYKWEFSDPPNLSPPNSQEELAKLSMKLYSLTLGLFERTGQTFIQISGSEIINGRKIVDYKIPIVF